MAETRPEWVHIDLGILGAGGVSGGIHPEQEAEPLGQALRDSRCRVLFVENEEQLDKALLVRERCPALQRIVIIDMKGLRDFADPMCESLQSFVARGAVDGDWDPASPRSPPSSQRCCCCRGSGAEPDVDPWRRAAPDRQCALAAAAARRRRAPGAAADVPRDGARAGPVSFARCPRDQQLPGKPRHRDREPAGGAANCAGHRSAHLATAACAHRQRRRRRHAHCSACCTAGRSPRVRVAARWRCWRASACCARSGANSAWAGCACAYIGGATLAPEIERWAAALGITLQHIDGQAARGPALDARYQALMQEAYGT